MKKRVAIQHDDAAALAFLRKYRGAIDFAINLEGVPAHQRDDVKQEVSIRIIERLRKQPLADTGHLGFAITVARNTSRTFCDKQRKHREGVPSDEARAYDALPDEQFDRLQARERMNACVSMLSGVSRFVMRKVLLGWTYKEIAEDMQVSHASIKTLVHRSKLRLRRLLLDPRNR